MRGTKKQRALLEKWGVEPPPTKGACGCLIAYILHGNGTGGENPFARIAIYRRCIEKWVGKRVSYPSYAAESSRERGIVQHLVARRSTEVADIKRRGDCVGPFALCIAWDNRPANVVSSYLATILDDDSAKTP